MVSQGRIVVCMFVPLHVRHNGRPVVENVSGEGLSVRAVDLLVQSHQIDGQASEERLVVKTKLYTPGQNTKELGFVTLKSVSPPCISLHHLIPNPKIDKSHEFVVSLELRLQQHVLEMEPHDDATHVLLSNMYAIARRWDVVASVRKNMQKKRMKEEPGLSWVENQGMVHYFTIGDTCHPDIKHIHAMLEWLKKTKDAGYVLDCDDVLLNVEDDEKEHLSWLHNERLALAFGLIQIPPLCSIRVEDARFVALTRNKLFKYPLCSWTSQSHDISTSASVHLHADMHAITGPRFGPALPILNCAARSIASQIPLYLADLEKQDIMPVMGSNQAELIGPSDNVSFNQIGLRWLGFIQGFIQLPLQTGPFF
ncbi:hypothetical protein VNO77_38986 [Canavalia gladiata]|uniref:DYW domain-containing protein n=1 Tax=Canavalia gladiata TaxID=3824 RepID=A0AAN9KA82_CANGL